MDDFSNEEEVGSFSVELKRCIAKIIVAERNIMLDLSMRSRVARVRHIADIVMQTAEHSAGDPLLCMAFSAVTVRRSESALSLSRRECA